MKRSTAITSALAIGLLVASATRLWAMDEHMNMEAPKMPAAFDQLKDLVGSWTGTMDMGGQSMEYTVTYELTSGGSAILEREFIGSPHEMTTVYCAEGNQVVMTHYCSMGNHPRMVLKSSTADTLVFEMKGSQGLKSAKEAHMHGLKLTRVDATHLKAEWTSYEAGKKKDVKVFDMTKKA